MRRTIKIPQLPGQQSVPVLGKEPGGKASIIRVPAIEWVIQSLNTLQQNFIDIVRLLNYSEQGVGPNIPSASVITVTYVIHHVTGTESISTIQTSPDFGGGIIYLIADDTWTLVTGGNIASNYAPPANTLVVLVYDLNLQTWYVR